MNRILAWFLVALIFAMSGPLQAATMASARGFEKSLYGRSAPRADKYAYCGGDPINASDPDGTNPILIGLAVAAGFEYYNEVSGNNARAEDAALVPVRLPNGHLKWMSKGSVSDRSSIVTAFIPGLPKSARATESAAIGAGGELGTDVASEALKQIIRSEAKELGYEVVESAVHNGDAHIIGKTLNIGTSSSKAVWLEEFGHLLDPNVRSGAARAGTARLAAETQIKQILINGADKYGLSPSAVAGLRSTLDGYRRRHQRGDL